MATLYNKTALNKIKKAELIQMFLDQQAKMIDIKMEAEEMNQKGWLEIAKREEEHKKLKELTKHYEENKKLLQETVNLQQKQIDKLKNTILSLKSSVDDLREARDNWKEIAKNKTRILMKYLPDYNPALMGGSDSENLEECFKQLIEENKKLKQYKDYFDKWSEILSDIDGDEFADLLEDYGWEYNDKGNLVKISVDYEDDEVDYYIDAGRKAVLKDGRIVKSKD